MIFNDRFCAEFSTNSVILISTVVTSGITPAELLSLISSQDENQHRFQPLLSTLQSSQGFSNEYVSITNWH